MSSAQPPVSSDVGKTVLLLIQAFLKTGYYQPGHPETEKAREGLYEAVQAGETFRAGRRGCGCHTAR